MKSILIIDGHNYLFKGFYGVPIQAKRPDGTTINAIYGFFSLLRNVLFHIDPKYILVTFDAESSINNKIKINPNYKAQRAATHDDVYSQLPLIKACLDILNIQWVADNANEADDLIGAYSSNFIEYGVNVYIGSNDFDFIQLVDDYIFILRTYHGVVTKFDKFQVLEKFGISPSQYLDYLALKGDDSDNIKGIKGIGKKRAVSLLTEYGNIEGIYKSINKLPIGLQKALYGQENFLYDQMEFLTIKTDTSLCRDFSLPAYKFSKKVVPDKMGLFLKDNWNEILSQSKVYR